MEKDIVYLNSKGGISKVVNDGSSHISIIDINGVKSSMSGWNISRSIFYWNNRNRKVIANIGGYYGALIGIKDIGATYSNDGTALAYAIPDVGIWLCPQKDGFTDKSLDNKFNLFVILIHENDHKSHVKDFKETFLSHSATYIKAMTSEYFVKSDENFQQEQVGSLIYHLYNAIENGENTKQSVESLVKEFNDKNGAGWEIADHYGKRQRLEVFS